MSKCVYMITYPNSKKYVGLDLTGTTLYFGSPSRAADIAAEMTPAQRWDFTIRKEILWESEDATDAEARAMEWRLIVEQRSNDPAIGYNVLPRLAATPNGSQATLTRKPPGVLNLLAYERGELLSAEFSPDVLRERKAGTYRGRIGDLNHWVDDVMARTGESIPYFDPAAATDGPRVVLLLQDPSKEAGEGSGFISRHNNDRTANNTYLAADWAGLPYASSLHWNVVPWWVTKNPAKKGVQLAQEAVRARPYLAEMLDRFETAPAAVVLIGRHAQEAWDALADQGLPTALSQVKTVPCPHTSPLVFPRTDKKTGFKNSQLVTQSFRLARQLAGLDL